VVFLVEGEQAFDAFPALRFRDRLEMLPVCDYMTVEFVALVVSLQDLKVTMRKRARHEMHVVEFGDLGGYGCGLLFFDHLVHHAAQLQPDPA
jgi:hypothetical protein